MSRRYVFIWALLFLAGRPGFLGAAEKTYDVVIRGGKIKATYTNPLQYSEGIAHVIVNGQRVIENGEHTKARPGRVLRHETGR